MIKNHNERILNTLREHPDREPTTEMKFRLKNELRMEAERMERKQSWFNLSKIVSVSVAAVFIGFLLFSSPSMESLKNGFFFGSGSEVPVVDDGDESIDTGKPVDEPAETEEKVPEIVEGFLKEIHEDLIKKEVWEEAATTLVVYLQALYSNNVEGIEKYGFHVGKTEKYYRSVIAFYEEHVDMETLKVVDVQFSLGEPDVFALLSYEDKSGDVKAVRYVITNSGDQALGEVYDTIQEQHEERAFLVTEEIEAAYGEFSQSYSNEALQELSDVEFVTLYFYTDQLGDYETLYELHILNEEKYLFPTKEQYLKEMEENRSPSLADTIEEDLLAMYRIHSRGESDDAIVVLILKGEDFPLNFRLTMEEGVGKSHWSPLQ